MLADSNILVYAINIRSPKHKTAKQFLSREVGNLTIADQNILESLRILTHPKFSPLPLSMEDAVDALMAIVKNSRVIHPDYKTRDIALEFVKRSNLVADQVFDAYLAATALSNGINIIATDNVKDFQKFPIKVLNPFS